MTTKEREDVRVGRSAKEIWAQAQEKLSKILKRPTFESWILLLQLIDIGDQEAELAVKNDFTKSMISGKHLEAINDALSDAAGRRIQAKSWSIRP